MSDGLRFEDSVGLFGAGSGVSTMANLRCDWCGLEYTGRERTDGEPHPDSPSISVAIFGQKQVAECCWADLEEAVVAHLPDILPWYHRILTARGDWITRDLAAMGALCDIADRLRAQAALPKRLSDG